MKIKQFSNNGFTLIELMTVVIIVGILAAIAYPAYMNHLYKARRSDAQTALLNLSVLMEHYFTENNTYSGATLTGFGFSSNLSPQGYYQLTIAPTATSYTLTATPVAGGPQAGDTSCPTLTLTSANVKGPSSTCWQ